jgi:hypothetical protein
MSGTYNRCPDCFSLKKRYMILDNKKICIDCYEEYAGEAYINREKEK